MYNHLVKQKGVVLIVALVFLIALTAVVAALMQNTTTDMKMAGASEEKTVATLEAFSAIDEIMFREVNAVVGENDFQKALIPAQFPRNVSADLVITNTLANIPTAQIEMPNSNQYALEQPCAHARRATSTETFSCNRLTLRLVRTYGRRGNNIITVVSEINQQLLNNN